MKRLLLIFFLFLLFSDALPAIAGNISTAPLNETSQNIPSFQEIQDKAGKTFIFWEQTSTIAQINSHFFIQRINHNGASIWGKDVELSCDSDRIQNSHKLIADDQGSVIITWEERTIRSEETNLFIQKIDSSGNKLWGTQGILISDVPGSQISPFISPDGKGGAFIVWSDSRNDLTGANWDIYAQRINAEGKALWQEGGLAISTDLRDEYIGKILPANDGGMTIIWDMVIPDISGAAEGYEFYFRKVNQTGEVVHTFNRENFLSLPVSNTNYALGGDILSDGNNGFFLSLALNDQQQVSTSLYLQHVLSTGDLVYAGAFGELVDNDVQNAKEINFQTDTIGNLKVTWLKKADNSSIIYTRQFDSHGNLDFIDSEPIQTELVTESQNHKSIDTLPVGSVEVFFTKADSNLNIHSQNKVNKSTLAKQIRKLPSITRMDLNKTIAEPEKHGNQSSTSDPRLAQTLKLTNKKEGLLQADMSKVKSAGTNPISIDHGKELYASSIQHKAAKALAYAHKMSYSKPVSTEGLVRTADIAYRPMTLSCLDTDDPLPDPPLQLIAVN